MGWSVHKSVLNLMVVIIAILVALVALSITYQRMGWVTKNFFTLREDAIKAIEAILKTKKIKFVKTVGPKVFRVFPTYAEMFYLPKKNLYIGVMQLAVPYIKISVGKVTPNNERFVDQLLEKIDYVISK